ncbi:hypothetical protein [Schleiferilactobacillus harbinensis]|uniref:Uncharacterized protein n=1 Tax=Schleiferilactobacillus harbinensis TaxID=304207 RepID=A0ABU7SZ91_9LACO
MQRIWHRLGRGTAVLFLFMAVPFIQGFTAMGEKIGILVLETLVALPLIWPVRRRNYGLPAALSLWRRIEHLEFIVVTDNTNQLDQEKRREFAQMVRGTRPLVTAFYAAGNWLSMMFYFLRWPVVGNLVISATWVIVLLALVIIYLVNASRVFNQHLLRRFLGLQLVVPLTLLWGLLITGVMRSNSYHYLMIYYLLLSVAVTAAIIYIIPNYQLRVLTNYTPVLNATTTVIMFVVTEFGTDIIKALMIGMGQLSGNSGVLLKAMFGAGTIPAIKTVLTLVSMIFLISGNIVALFINRHRVASETQLRTLLVSRPTVITPELYHELQAIVYHGSIYSTLYLASNPPLDSAIRDYERTNGNISRG